MEIRSTGPSYTPAESTGVSEQEEAPPESSEESEAPEPVEPVDSAHLGEEAGQSPTSAGPDMQAMAEDFQYQSVPLKDHSGANFWSADQPRPGSESGTQANAQINQDYSHLSKAADRYMTGDTGAPRLNNFFEFAEQASTAVGEQIRNIENVQKGANGSATSAVKAGQSMLNGQQLDQAKRVYDATMRDQADQVVRQHPNDNSVLNGSRVLGGTAGQMWGEMDTTRDALVNGNTAIHKQLGPAADTFFKGEADGGKGLDALKAEGIYPGSNKDPDGLITRAFTSMQKVHDLAQQWEKAGTPEEKERIQKEREQAAKDSVFSFMMHEQGHILQRGSIFDDPTMKRNLQAITPTMTFKDTNGEHGQLGQGQDYSNFKQRLGLNEVPAGTAGAYPLTKNGQTRHYMPDASQQGSIVDYFSRNMGESKAAPMIDSGPRNLEAPPASQSGRGTLQLAEGIDRGDFSTMAAGGVRTVGGAAADGTRWVGDQLDQGGEALAISGARQAQQGGVWNNTAGTAKMVTGVALHGGGKLVEGAGRLGGAAVDLAADATDATINWGANTAKGLWRWATDW